jgi:hypothetical protein
LSGVGGVGIGCAGQALTKREACGALLRAKFAHSSIVIVGISTTQTAICSTVRTGSSAMDTTAIGDVVVRNARSAFITCTVEAILVGAGHAGRSGSVVAEVILRIAAQAERRTITCTAASGAPRADGTFQVVPQNAVRTVRYSHTFCAASFARLAGVTRVIRPEGAAETGILAAQ